MRKLFAKAQDPISCETHALGAVAALGGGLLYLLRGVWTDAGFQVPAMAGPQPQPAPGRTTLEKDPAVFISVPVFGLFLQADVRSPEHGVLAGPALLGIVPQGCRRRTGEDRDHRNVDEHHDAHQHVRQVPHQIQREAGAQENQSHGNQPEHHP